MNGLYFKQLKALVYKNYLYKRKNKKKTFIEFYFFAFITFFIVLEYSIVPKSLYEHNEKSHNVYSNIINGASIKEKLFTEEKRNNIGFVIPNNNSSNNNNNTNSNSNDLINMILDNKLFQGVDLKTKVFNNDKDMEEFYRLNTDKLLAGIIINQDLSSYTIRVDGISIPNPSSIIRDIRTLVKKDVNDYLDLFTPLQMAIDQALIQLKTGDKSIDITMNIGELPEKEIDEKLYLTIIDVISIFMMEMIFIIPIVNVIQLIVIENKSKIKFYLLSVGLHPSSFWISWFISNIIYFIGLVSLMCILFSAFRVFPFFICLSLFVFLCIFCNSLINVGLLLSTLFKIPKTSYSVTDIFLTLFGITYILFHYCSKNIQLIMSFILSPVSFGLAAEKLMLFKKSPSLISIVTDKEIILPLICLIWNTVLYFIIAILFDYIFSGKNQSFITFGRKKFNNKNLNSYKRDSISTNQNDIEQYHGYESSYIEVKNLVKGYKNYKSTILAINDVSFKAYNNEIFCLLGHNGAGKTTLINIMTRLIQPDNGIVTFDGNELNKNISDIQQDLGICTQDNILFDLLSVEENINIFCRLKGIKDNVDEILNKIDLWNKKETDVENLSEGQKRKLCIGISILGNPKYLFLDEPTTGLDPVSRRHIWRLLSSIKRDKIIFLTTNYMDEADILADRIVILSNGIIRCLGTSLYLKNHFNMMYSLKIKTKYLNEINQVIQSFVPNAIFDNNSLTTDFNIINEIMCKSEHNYLWRLPLDSTNNFKLLFKELNRFKKQGVVKNYSIKSPSLEELYIKLTKNDSLSNKEIKSEKKKLKLNENKNITKDNEILIIKDYMDLPRPSPQQKVSSFTKLRRLIKLRYKIYLRDKLFLSNTFFTPVLLSLGLFLVLKYSKSINNNKIIEFKEAEISPYTIYNKEIWNYDINSSNLGKEFFLNRSPLTNIEYNNITSFNNYTYSPLYNKDYISSISGILENNSSIYIFDLYYNCTKLHSIPAMINHVSNLILSSKNVNSKISVKSHPFPYYDLYDKQIGFSIIGMLIGIILICSLVKYGALVTKERTELILKQLHLNNISNKIYWTSVLFTDFSLSIITWFLIILVAILCKYEAFNNLNAIIILIISCILCSFGSLLFQYFLSFSFKTTEQAYSLLPTINLSFIILGYGMNIFISVINYNSSSLDSMYNITFIFFQIILSFIYPTSGFISIINSLSWIKVFNSINPKKYPLTFGTYFDLNGGILPLLIAVFISIIIYFSILISLNKKHNSVKYRINAISRDIIEKNEDYLSRNEIDVYNEYKLVHKNYRHYPISVLNVHKTFKNKSKEKLEGPYQTILENVTFHVNQNECFGLLGPNGVGKSTTLNILTNTIPPSYGHIFFDGLNRNELSRLNLGYCSQNNIFWNELTVREHLELVLELRGYPKSVIKDTANQYIFYFDLEDYQHQLMKHINGGIKRKVSFLLAICGYPEYIILDEPTSGMDPYNRHFIWNVIQEIKNKCQSSIILTTHSMDEAETLCDRLTILLNGRLSCIGSPEYLTMNYATNYILDIESDVLDLVHEEIFLNPSSILHKVHYTYEKETNRRCKYTIERKYNVGKLFEILEKAKNENKIYDYTITQSSLEDVFIDFVKKSQ